MDMINTPRALADGPGGEDGPDLAHELSAYFLQMGGLPAAAVQVNDSKGMVFFDVTIEGVRFQGHMAGDPYLSRMTDGHRQAPFGVSRICDVSPQPRESWRIFGPCVCKYDPRQPRVGLNGLSERGITALAMTFGLLVDPRIIPLTRAGIGRLLLTSPYAPAYAFFRSPAAVALQGWCAAHPRLAKKLQSRTDYLLNWPQHIGQPWTAT